MSKFIEEKNRYTTDDQRAALKKLCSDLLGTPSVLSQLDQDIKRHGFAGSTNIPLLVYLATFTRMNKFPVSLVIKGNSGSGKSFSLQCGLRYVPKHIYDEVHGMSQKALVHSSYRNLKNRFLVIQEAAGFAKDGWVFLRQMLTEGKLAYMSVAQTKDGHEGKELPTVEGPMGVMMTTTANALHNEDESRLLSLYVDQSPEQIKRALMTNATGGQSSPSEEELARWHAFHDYVCSGSFEVCIPFQDALLDQLPTSHARVLRDTPKVLDLIRVHALLHQDSRDREDGKVVATFDDYEAVHKLVSEPLAYGLRASVPPHIADVVSASLALYEENKRPVTQVEVAKRLGRDQSVISRNLTIAIKDGFLINENPGQGRSHAYVPGERKLASNAVLPMPAELRKGHNPPSLVAELKPVTERWVTVPVD